MTTQMVWGLLLPFAGTTLGAGCVFFLRRQLRRGVQRVLAGFAAGVMTAASVWSLLLPALEEAEAAGLDFRSGPEENRSPPRRGVSPGRVPSGTGYSQSRHFSPETRTHPWRSRRRCSLNAVLPAINVRCAESASAFVLVALFVLMEIRFGSSKTYAKGASNALRHVPTERLLHTAA